MIIPGIMASQISGHLTSGFLSSLVGSINGTYGGGVATDSTGNIFMAGTLRNASGGYTASISKYNAPGAIQWQRNLTDANTAASQRDFANQTAVDSSGNVFVGGQYANTSAGLDGFIAKYNNSGTLQWQRSLADSNTAANQGVSVNAITLDSSGNVIVVGYFSNSSLGLNSFIAKYNTSGTLQWQRILSDPQSAASQTDYLFGVVSDSSNNIYTVGYSLVQNIYSFNLVVIKYNSSGSLQWQRYLKDTRVANSEDDEGYGIAVDNSANVYVVGEAYNSSAGYVMVLVKYNSSGTLQWQRQLADSNAAASQFGRGTGVVTDGSSYVYVTGRYSNTSGGTNMPIVKYNLSGAIQWQRSIVDGQAAANQNDQGKGICLDLNGNICFMGIASRPGGTYLLLAKVPNDGSHTGTYTISGTQTLTYGTPSLTDSAGTLVDVAGTLTDASGTLTDSAGILTDSAGSFTSATISI